MLVLWALNGFSKADPKQVARLVRWLGGGATLLFAVFLLLRGEIGLAVPIGSVGLGLLGWISLWPAGFGARTQKSPGQASRVRSAFLEMELDHDTGAMRGRILGWAARGRRRSMRSTCRRCSVFSPRSTAKAARYLAYLDRREPRWRENAQGDAAAGERQRRRAAAK